MRSLIAVMLVAAVAFTACGDDGSTDASPRDEATTAEPVAGGELTMAVYTEAQGLDPLASSVAGTNGGSELFAVYDSLLRYNPEDGSYEPRTAESVTPDDTYTTWEVKIRPGITFSDGTAYDAAAVKAGLERHKLPANRTNTAGYLQNVSHIEVVDELTLTITLTEPWPGFEGALAGPAGMIPSPTAIAACGDTAPRDCEFNRNPVGAGPFTLEAFRPGEVISLVKRDDYWGGDVYLNRLRFVPIAAGSQAAFETLRTGGVDVAFLREPQAIDAAKAAGFAGHTNLIQNAANLLMNVGLTVDCKDGAPSPKCDGQPDGPVVIESPTNDIRIRRAVAAAIDLDVVNVRAFGGKGLMGSSLLQESSLFYSGDEGPTYDPDLARRLVEEVKAEGWDGRIRYLSDNVKVDVDRSQAIRTMLESVGFIVDLDITKSIADRTAQVIVSKDFDLALWGSPGLENSDLAWALLDNNLRSDSASNRTGYTSEAMDEALRQLKLAATLDEKKAAYSTISKLLYEDLPWLVEGAVEEYIARADHVHGMVPGSTASFYLDKAWVSR